MRLAPVSCIPGKLSGICKCACKEGKKQMRKGGGKKTRAERTGPQISPTTSYTFCSKYVSVAVVQVKIIWGMKGKKGERETDRDRELP